MNSYAKSGLACAAIFLLCSIAAPSSSAQTRSQSRPYVLQLNSSGGEAYLGIEMDEVTSSNMSKYKLSGERGVIVRSVQPGTPASEAKLQEDDVIVEYAGEKVWSSRQFARLVGETPPGRKVDLGVSRDGKHITLTAEIRTRDIRRSESQPFDFPGDLGQMFRNYQYRALPNLRDGTADEPTEKPRLGVTLRPLTDQFAEFLGVPGKKGALIDSVLEGSPSAGKLKSGDVVVQADGKEIGTPEDVIGIVRDKSEGNLTLKIIRDKKPLSVVVALPAAPSGSEGGRGGIKL